MTVIKPPGRQGLSSNTKILIGYAASLVICITSYYYARIWVVDQRTENMKVRQKINSRYGLDYVKQLKKGETTAVETGQDPVDLNNK